MIDGYKILNLPVNMDELKNNPLLSFEGKYNERDFDILIDKPLTALYKEQIFTIKNHNAKLKGSLHKFHNNGIHNYNDFYFSDLTNAIFDLCIKFNIPAEVTEFNNLEFGVNIYIPIAPEELFKYVINYRGTMFQKFNIPNSKGIECIKSNFIIKMYDKGNQYKLPGNLLRFEIKVVRMQFFIDNGVNIKTLADLTNINNIYPLQTILRGIFDDILMYDYSIIESNLNDRERLIISNGRNPKYWENLLPKSEKFKHGNKDKQYIKQRKKYYRELSNFKKIIEKYSTSTIQNDISVLIEIKCNELLTINDKKGDKLTELSEPQKTTEKGQINISNIVSICPQPFHKCKTCGSEYKPTKKNKKFCSKKCKNKFTNPRLNPKNNLLKRLGNISSGNLLFDVSEYIVLSDQQSELLTQKNTIQNYV